ncbi:MAG: bifunctional DNA-formamidopyrimidine glycosylase/DNA-(apurinic or apyrimidinic site) lyase [Galactobacter sp.]
MPELPEVEVVRRGLESWVVGRRIERVSVLDARSIRRHHDGPEDFVASLHNVTVRAAVRRGKFLWLPLSEPPVPDGGSSPTAVPAALVAHLGMSGQLLVEEARAPMEKHARVVLELEERTGLPGQLRFVDQRIFGGMWLSPLIPTSDGLPGGAGDPGPVLPEDAAHIARDVLDPSVAADEAGISAAARRLRRGWMHRSAPVKSVLLDQTQISGVGNIYADEALWRARMHYLTPSGALGPTRIAELLCALRDVMMDALAAGGTSFDSLYVNVNGASGYFARSLHAYGREGEPCDRCRENGHAGRIVREAYSGRSSYRCTYCQRVPRSSGRG